jgi:hypothetical protein
VVIQLIDFSYPLLDTGLADLVAVLLQAASKKAPDTATVAVRIFLKLLTVLSSLGQKTFL